MLARPELSDENQQLLEAVDLIKERGWWDGEGNELNRNRRLCLVMAIDQAGAIRECEGDKNYYYDLIDRLIRIIGYKNITDWNDTHSEQEVINLMKETAYGDLGHEVKG